MMKYAFYLLALVACGQSEKNQPEKTYCSASDCVDGTACVAGVCQPASHDACGASRTACAADATCTQSSDGLACTCNSGFTGDGASYCAPKGFTKVAASGNFTCALVDGGIYCWGQNVYGDVGDGTLLPRPHPVQVGTDTDWIDVDAQNSTACGLKTDHTMWCWGLGSAGQLGDGKAMTEYAPTNVISDKPGIGWKTMALGRQTVCGLHEDGSIACWGLDRVTGTTVATPRAVGTDTDWTDLSVGTAICGIRGTPGAAGALYCWGKSSTGELGLGDEVTSQATPARVGTDLWKRVDVGSDVACGIGSDGALLCWGTNTFLNVLTYGSTPTQVGTATDWEAISVSFDAIIGLRTGGHAYAWGVNDFGQLGVAGIAAVADPTPLSGPIARWTQISSGNSHGCGISSNQAYCWGAVGEGFLGDGSSTGLYSPTKIGDSQFTSAADGAGACGLRSDGALVCWGDTFAGVGFGNTDPVWTPMRLGTDTWTSVFGSADGVASMCAIRGGVPYCWGDNASGQLGIGDGMPVALSPTAVHVPPGTQWTEISVGIHSCAITATGALWCWGDNRDGELGSGAVGAPVTAPSAPLAGTWLHVAAESFNAGAQTCAIRSDHTMWCWGRDQYPSRTLDVVPTQVGSEASWASLSGAWFNEPTTCAIKLDGSLWCWGTRLGNGTTESSVVPQRVGIDNDWRSVSVGNEVCAIKTGGSLWCWDNLDVLGDGTPVLYVDPSVDTTTRFPTQIGHDTDWSTVAIGGGSCAVKLDGSLWCWGSREAPVPAIATMPVLVH